MYSNIVLIIIGLIFIIFGFHKWYSINGNYFKKRGIPHMEQNSIMKTFTLMTKYSFPELIMNIYNKYENKKIIGIFSFRQPSYFLTDPETIKKLTIKDFDYFENHRTFVDPESDPLFGNSLFMLKGQKWRDMRATLSPAFTGSKMRQMFEFVIECADQMTQNFRTKSTNGATLNVDVKEIFSRYTNDVIATCAFGVKINSFENLNNEFYTAGMLLLNFKKFKNFLRVLFIQLFPSIMRMLRIGFIDGKIGKFFHSMVLDTMAIRNRNNIYRPDMINILMQVKNRKFGEKTKTHTIDDRGEVSGVTSTDDGFATVEESNIGKLQIDKQWNDDEIVAQCFLFFFAGFETTSTLLLFAAYEIVRDVNIQERLYEEIQRTNQVLDGKPLTYEVLQKMKYMDMFVSEALRMWPPAVATDRICVKSYMYDDGENKFQIDKDLALTIPIYAFHHDPKYFPNPEKFDPERFNDENRKNINPLTYLPFGVGPRNCIGSRFALMEIKAVFYYLLLSFTMEPNSDTQIPIILQKTPFGMIPEKDVRFTLKLREK